MVPPTILRQLNRLRGRERRLRLAWGAARWLAVVVAALFVGSVCGLAVLLRGRARRPCVSLAK